MTDIFISYSRSDQAWVARLAKAFGELGYDVWWDTQLLAGEDFAHIIPTELEKARCVVVVWSKVSVTRKWVRSEATRADNRGVLIPVSCEAADIPMPLDLLHTEDMRGWNGKPEHPAFQKLLQAVSRYCPAPGLSTGSGELPPIKDPPPPLPPKKFPWLPALLISAVVLGSGVYWQMQGKSSVGASLAGDSFTSPPVAIDPAEAERKAKEAQANELAQAKATLEAWPDAITRLTTLAESGDTSAMQVLGASYYVGHGVDKDQQRACQLYKQAVDAGDAKAEETYANLPNCH
ncbi:TIR domain-containing protein [Thiothrix nivea]|uniref:Sel1 domain protein repeat-containing protein n=1 Tax=Thiothrix nivea (strain ATCC 35100 / DSM 5205 / JP2) TaxID=870187 RepID=A0A656HEU4_THINJ|nr:TIR domain-containing protein [Thiothrix nivea]EIJ33709.1 Sel1 domain protein repeat-containing protein [Thiothrix nivea DSM 5205]